MIVSDGFHPILSHPASEPRQTKAVRVATQRHIELYNQIAANNAHVCADIRDFYSKFLA